MPKVMVGMCVGSDYIAKDTALALLCLDCTGVKTIPHIIKWYEVDQARNMLARHALDSGCDYLFMVDSDTVPPKHALQTMLSNDVEVCLGYYERTGSTDGGTPIVRLGATGWDSKDMLSDAEIAEARESGTTLMEVKGGGMGCALINTDMFRRFERPWFQFIDYHNGVKWGEDYWFCNKCHEQRVRVYLDTRIGCGHVKLVEKKVR